ncbi:MAG: GntR family transcriptional regulator [Pirellulales bacterium]|nr:GntR family transcriptional regulator [Pirellulales bacterium]
MSNTTIETSKIGSLAAQIERDIRKRGLTTGDRYLTGAEAGLLLGVSTASANRAMSLLVDRNLLVRRRRSGTFVGSKINSQAVSRTCSVYVLTMEHQSQDIPSTDLLLQGIRAGIASANVHFGFLPEVDRLTYVKELLRDSMRSGQLAGVVPISCGREVYQYLLDAGIPTVVLGSVYESMDRLASIDMDNYQMARLLAGHLFHQGHRRVAVIDNSRGCPGDNYFSDGISEATADACLPANSVLMRFLPDIESVFAQVREMLASDWPPTGFVARTPRLANAVEQALKYCGVTENRFEIVFQDYHTSTVKKSRFTFARPKDNFAAMAIQIGKTLHRLGEDPSWKPEHIVIPVELCHPQ